MSWFKDLFRRKPDRFIELLLQQADYTVQGTEALLDYLRKPNRSHVKKIGRIEKDADEVRRVLIEELNQTFVTPIDREDIHALSRDIDDVLDYAYTTVDEMVILDVAPNKYLERMASLLSEAAQEIQLSVVRLRDHPRVSQDHAQRAKALENRIETVYREALADLFRAPKDQERESLEHVVSIFKLREIYRHLSNAADRGDEAANVLSDIVVKMV
mgnify:CR=1 FL=1